MTKTAIEMKKIAAQKEMQAKEHKWKSSENKKDRIKDYALKGGDVAGRLLGNVVLKKNDPAWYKRYVKDLDKFTNIPTFHRLGVPLIKGSYTSYNVTGSQNSAIPGIMTFHYEDMVGPQTNPTQAMSLNPVNQILMRSKEQVLKSNSRSSVNWEAADLGLNLFATASIITMMGEYKRLILCAQTYSATNAYLGMGLLRAYGFTESRAAQFISDLAAHRKNYIILAHRFNNAIVAPADLTLFRRKWYLATNVFADNSDPTRPQLYWFIDEHSHRLNDTGDKLVADSRLFTTVSGDSVVKPWFDYISKMITSIVDNPDFQEMYADLRSAFGDNILKLEETLNEDEVLNINIDELNREQIRNLKTMPIGITSDPAAIQYASAATEALTIVSDTTGYLYQGVISGTKIQREFQYQGEDLQTIQASDKVIDYEYGINSPKRDLYNVQSLSSVNGDTILDITRFRFNAEFIFKSNDTYVRLDVTDCGTEVVSYAEISVYTTDATSSFRSEVVGSCFIYQPTTLSADHHFECLRNLSYYSAFDWSPNIRIYMLKSDASFDVTQPVVCTMGDMTNTFAINASDLSSIHQACVLSELYLDNTTFKR